MFGIVAGLTKNTSVKKKYCPGQNKRLGLSDILIAHECRVIKVVISGHFQV